MQVVLFKRKGSYVDKETGEAKTPTNFYILCGDEYIPINVTFFPDKETGKDPNYRSRKSILSAFADEMPERQTKGQGNVREVAVSNAEEDAANVPF